MDEQQQEATFSNYNTIKTRQRESPEAPTDTRDVKKAKISNRDHGSDEEHDVKQDEGENNEQSQMVRCALFADRFSSVALADLGEEKLLSELKNKSLKFIFAQLKSSVEDAENFANDSHLNWAVTLAQKIKVTRESCK